MYALLWLAGSVWCYNNGLGRTPNMGWNPWNSFYCDVNETLIMQAADKLIETGLAAKGYTVVNIDDCWA
jgi:alpha-galactosidase